jgi:hypothetical protein
MSDLTPRIVPMDEHQLAVRPRACRADQVVHHRPRDRHASGASGVARHAEQRPGTDNTNRSPFPSDEDRAAVAVELEPGPGDELHTRIDWPARAGAYGGGRECRSHRPGKCRMPSRRAMLAPTGTLPSSTTTRMKGPHARGNHQQRHPTFSVRGTRPAPTRPRLRRGRGAREFPAA